VAADDFSNRMRDRMPSHNVWREPGSTPAVSRPANDALWDEMRSRMRTYQEFRRETEERDNFLLAAVEHIKRPSGARNVGALVVAGGLIIVSIYELIR
jgi:hypothetical protein